MIRGNVITKKHQRSAIFTLAGGFIIGAALIVFGACRMTCAGDLAIESRNWPSTNGVVVSCGISKTSGGRELAVKYRYSVNGRRYTGTRIAFDRPYYWRDREQTTPGERSRERASTNKAQRKYPKGSTVKVWYKKSSPKESVLEQSHFAMVLLSNGGFLFFGCFVIFIFAGILFRKRTWDVLRGETPSLERLLARHKVTAANIRKILVGRDDGGGTILPEYCLEEPAQIARFWREVLTTAVVTENYNPPDVRLLHLHSDTSRDRPAIVLRINGSGAVLMENIGAHYLYRCDISSWRP